MALVHKCIEDIINIGGINTSSSKDLFYQFIKGLTSKFGALHQLEALKDIRPTPFNFTFGKYFLNPGILSGGVVRYI